MMSSAKAFIPVVTHFQSLRNLLISGLWMAQWSLQGFLEE